MSCRLGGGDAGVTVYAAACTVYTATGGGLVGGGGTTFLVSKHTNINETIEIRKTEQNMMKDVTINALYLR